MDILLAFCSACHPRRFDMPHGHVKKRPPAPQRPKVPGSQGAGPKKIVVARPIYVSNSHIKFG